MIAALVNTSLAADTAGGTTNGTDVTNFKANYAFNVTQTVGTNPLTIASLGSNTVSLTTAGGEDAGPGMAVATATSNAVTDGTNSLTFTATAKTGSAAAGTLGNYVANGSGNGVQVVLKQSGTAASNRATFDTTGGNNILTITVGKAAGITANALNTFLSTASNITLVGATTAAQRTGTLNNYSFLFSAPQRGPRTATASTYATISSANGTDGGTVYFGSSIASGGLESGRQPGHRDHDPHRRQRQRPGRHGDGQPGFGCQCAESGLRGIDRPVGYHPW